MDAFDLQGNTVDFPPDIGLLGALGMVPSEAIELELLPGARAEATVIWRARGYDPDKKYAHKAHGFELPDPEPLKPGKYRLTIKLPAVAEPTSHLVLVTR